MEKAAGRRDSSEPILKVHVPPGATGCVQVNMRTDGRPGRNRVRVRVGTTDPEVPWVDLATSVQVLPRFICRPREVRLLDVDWRIPADFLVKVESMRYPDLEITGIQSAPVKMHARYQKHRIDGRNLWVVQGQYGPELTYLDRGGLLVLSTNIERKTVSIPVAVEHREVVRVTPGNFVSLGVIERGGEARVPIVIRALDGHVFDNVTTQLIGCNLQGDEIKITRVSKSKAPVVELTIEAKPKPRQRLLLGSLLVRTKHPYVGTLAFRFVGRQR